MDYWPQVEADFAQFYGITDPLGLGWRRLKTLLNGLPPDSRVAQIMSYDSLSWKDKHDLKYGRRRARTRGSIHDIPGGSVTTRRG